MLKVGNIKNNFINHFPDEKSPQVMKGMSKTKTIYHYPQLTRTEPRISSCQYFKKFYKDDDNPQERRAGKSLPEV